MSSQRRISGPLAGGSRFLVKLDAEAEVETLDGSIGARFTGEAILRARGDHPRRRELIVERFVLAGASVETAGEETGVISVVGRSSHGSLLLEDDRIGFRSEIETDLNYLKLDRDAGLLEHEGCYYEPKFLPSRVVFAGELSPDEEGGFTATGQLSLACAADEGEVIKAIRFPLDRVRWDRLVSADVANCHPDLTANRRRLVVQPVGFRSSAADPSPSGSTAAAQFATAQTVWGKSCIEFDVKPVHLITDATLKTSSDLAAIRDSFTDPDPNVIEVFFVQNSLPATGGGNAGGIGVASCKVVMAEPNGGNPVLLSHELGHVLGLFHPGPGSNSDPGTVMAPTGSAMNPGTEFVTHYMCTNIASPVLQTLLTTCCLTHDIGDHYIRDYPEDAGAEPSTPFPPGRNQYSMSNVWNRRANSPGTMTPDGPQHQNPARFQMDGVTPHTNHLFARVEQVASFPVRDASVLFYIKHPGSGGGAITFLGAVPVPSGTPQTVSLPWTVPAGTPTHSCVFAIVRSPAEPESDPSGLSWQQFEARVREDNDWAQRNLDIQNVASSNLADGNRVVGAPFVVRIPVEQAREPLPIRIRVDSRRARGLRSLSLEVAGHGRQKLSPGEAQELDLKARIRPGRDFVMAVHAELSAEVEVGNVFQVHVDPVVDDVEMAGYATRFRIAPPSEVVDSCLDALLAAFTDLAEAMGATHAYRLVRRVRSYLLTGPHSLEELLEFTEGLEEELRSLVGEVAKAPIAEGYEILEVFERWTDRGKRKKKHARRGHAGSDGVLGDLCQLAGRLHLIASRWLSERKGKLEAAEMALPPIV